MIPVIPLTVRIRGCSKACRNDSGSSGDPGAAGEIGSVISVAEKGSGPELGFDKEADKQRE